MLGRPARYPWDKWFSKKTFRVKPSDYTCRLDVMVQQIRQRASRVGVRASVRIDAESIIHVTVLEK